MKLKTFQLEAMEEIQDVIQSWKPKKAILFKLYLIGQPELKYKLQRNDLKQFAQRVSSHYHINGLNKDEVQKLHSLSLESWRSKKSRYFSDRRYRNSSTSILQGFPE